MFALVRNLGQSMGISAMTLISIQQTAQVSARLTEGMRPDNPMLDWARPGMDFGDPATLTRTAGEIWRQATMVATIDAFWLSCLVALATIPVIFLMKKQKLGQTVPAPSVDH